MTTPLFQSVKQTIRSNVSNDHPVPLFFNKAIDFFAKWHVVYRWVIKDRQWINREQQLINNKQGDPRLHALGYLIGSEISTTFRYALQLGIIIKCMDELFHHHVKIYQGYCSLKNTRFYYCSSLSPSKQIKWLSVISPGMELHLRNQISRFKQLCVRILRCLTRLGWQIIETAMCYRDVYLILTSDIHAKMRAYTELAVSILEWRTKILKDERFLYQEITKREILITKIIEKLPEEEKTKYGNALVIAKQKSIGLFIEGVKAVGKIVSPILDVDHFGKIEVVIKNEQPVPTFSTSKEAPISRAQQTKLAQKKAQTWFGTKNS